MKGTRPMTNDEIAIPLVVGDEHAHFHLSGPSLLEDQPSEAATPLETQRFGLLAAPAAPADGHRRMEDWIASNLDLECNAAPSSPRSAWHRIIAGIPGLRRAPNSRAKREERKGGEAALEGWTRFNVAYRRGVTVVRLIDKALVKEAQIQELNCDLLDLIEAGSHRVVLNFQGVERLASMVVVAVEEARRRCAAADGGGLKICNLDPGLADIFTIAGVKSGIGFHADETTALDTPWPEPSGPRALPIEILSALTKAADIPPIQGGAPSETAGVAKSNSPRLDLKTTIDPPVTSPITPALTGVWLDVHVGGSKGRQVAVGGLRFTIGRDRSCQLRLGSPMVSKMHASIERREGRVFLHDLGSTNGTILNGKLLRGREEEIRHGDRIQIGPIVATLLLGAPKPEVVEVEAQVAGWLHTEGSEPRSYHGDTLATDLMPTYDDAEPERKIKHEVIQEILVITPQVSNLDDAESIEMLRSHFQALFGQALPRRVVVNLEYIGHLSAQAIGVLLAHHLRLDRAGGGMRICQARARIMAVMHQVRLTMRVDCHPTLDEAVLGSWTLPPKLAATEA
jgi:anti-anti-sigma regulatory factor